MTAPLNSLFKPRSVAVIGASANPAKLGHIVLKNILDGGFPGKLYGVHPSGESVLGVDTYASVGDIPGRVELAVAAVPAPSVVTVAEDCGKAGVKGLIVIAAGFREVGGEGVAREETLMAVARKYGMRVLGPNCLGIIDPVHQLDASFGGIMPKRGHIAVASQSGAMCTAILDWAKEVDLGFSSFVSLGNKADITENDLLESWASDSESKVVLAYLEGISDGPRFLSDAARLTARKPFVLLKAGTSEQGAAAVSSHTGSVTGADDVLDAALRQAGITRARSIGDLFDFALAFAETPAPSGKRVAIVTNAGGPGVVTTDAVIEAGLEIAGLGTATKSRLHKALPAEASVHNPVDCIGDARADRYETALSAVLADKGVDSVIVLLTPQAMTEIDETARVIIEAREKSAKPILASFMGGQAVASGLALLQKDGVAAYQSPERAVRSLAALTAHALHQREKVPTGGTPKPASRTALRTARRAGHAALWGTEAGSFLKPYGIRVPEVVLAKDGREADRAAKKLGFPVVIKVDSPDILHKTEAGGVRLGVGAGEVADAYDGMIREVRRKRPKARIRGAVVQQMIGDGHDFLIGGKRDPTFGPVVVFGYGGIYVEVFHDISVALAPLSPAQAEAMIGRTRSAALLTGARGLAISDKQALVKALVGVSRVMADFPEIEELDLNPIRVFPKGALALDIRVILGNQVS